MSSINPASSEDDDGPDASRRKPRKEVTRPTGGPVVAVLEAVRGVIDKVLAVSCVVIFFGLVVVVAWQVFSRQVLGAPASWTEESARYVFVILALLGSALVFSERGHIAVEVFINRLSTGPKRIVALIIEASIMFFAVYIMVYGGYQVAMTSWNQNISTMPVTVGQVYLILPIVGVLVTFFALCHVVGMFAGTEDLVAEIDENNQGI